MTDSKQETKVKVCLVKRDRHTSFVILWAAGTRCKI